MFVMLARLTIPLSAVCGASKRSRSFNSIGVTVRLRIVNGGSAIASVEDEAKIGVSLRSLKAFRIRCDSGDAGQPSELGGLGSSFDRLCSGQRRNLQD